MTIARERYLDDSRQWFLSLELRTRTAEMHSAMDALSPEQRLAIGDVLVGALDHIAGIVEPVAMERGAKPVRRAAHRS
jgi:hypothetical protein